MSQNISGIVLMEDNDQIELKKLNYSKNNLPTMHPHIISRSICFYIYIYKYLYIRLTLMHKKLCADLALETGGSQYLCLISLI